MTLVSNAEILTSHDEARRRFLRARLGEAGLAAALEMRDMQVDAIAELTDEEADAYFGTLSQAVDDPLLEAELAFSQRISELWVPAMGYDIMYADSVTGLHLERRLGRSAAAGGLFHTVERLDATLKFDASLRLTKQLLGVGDDGETFRKLRPIYMGDRLAVMMAMDQLSEIDELIHIELDA